MFWHVKAIHTCTCAIGVQLFCLAFMLHHVCWYVRHNRVVQKLGVVLGCRYVRHGRAVEEPGAHGQFLCSSSISRFSRVWRVFCFAFTACNGNIKIVGNLIPCGDCGIPQSMCELCVCHYIILLHMYQLVMRLVWACSTFQGNKNYINKAN